MKAQKRLNKDDLVLVEFVASNFDGMTLTDMAAQLSGSYLSKSGRPLTTSHLSNFARRDLGLRKVSKYEKKNYKGWNWLLKNKAKRGEKVELKNATTTTADSFKQLADELFEARKKLTKWELGFVCHVRNVLADGGTLTRDQQDKLSEIYKERLC